MLKTKVIAVGIENLSDARYFAAWGVDYISFNAKTLSRSEIAEMIQWVEGPDYLLSNTELSTNHENIPGIVGVIEQPALENGFLTSEIRLNSSAKKMKIVYIEGVEMLPKSSDFENQDFIFFDSKSPLKTLSQIGKSNAGVVLHGGKEEAVGLKDFEALDEILEALQIND